MSTGVDVRRLFAAGASVALACAVAPRAGGVDTARLRRHLPRASEVVCGSAKPVSAWPRSGFYLEMEGVGQVFHVWVTSEAGTASVRAWLAGSPRTTRLGIPGAPIELDPTFNPGYSYRLKPGDVVFAEIWIELCDASPCFVEKDAAAWLKNPGTWCPWAAQVRKVWDCAGGDGTTCGEPVFQTP